MIGRILVVLLFVFTRVAICQDLVGRVVEVGTNTPLVGAHIYIINSLQGTVSNANGEFLVSPPNAYGELLVTYIGYTDQKISFTPASQILKINLSPASNKLEEVSIKGDEDKKWKKLYKKFEASFLGSTANAKHCTISNPWVVDVTKGANGEIIASSKEPIEIINSALGYKLTFHLTNFTLKLDRLHYHGFVYFDELKPDAPTEKKVWEKNRKKTYLGSLKHFLIALNDQNLESEGFEVYLAEFTPGIGFTTKTRKKESYLLKTEKELSIPDYLKIVYTKAQPQRAYLVNHQSQSSFAFQGPKADLVPKGNLKMSTQSANSQVSYLFSRNSKLIFTDNGYVINNKYIIEYGYWSWLGVAEMLPSEYKLTL